MKFVTEWVAPRGLVLHPDDYELLRVLPRHGITPWTIRCAVLEFGEWSRDWTLGL